jgi:hypothetical protein
MPRDARSIGWRYTMSAGLLLVLAGCGIGAPWPTVNATDGHRNIVFFGDSLMGGTVTGLPAAFSSRGIDAAVYDEHVNGSGLVSPILGLDPLDYVRQTFDEHPDADIAVFEWAGACTRPCALPYGSDAFMDAWYAKAHDVVELARSRGVTVLWTISPPPPPGPGDPNGAYDYDEATGIALSWKSRGFIYAEGIGYADWWGALMATDDFLGHYDQTLYYDDAWHDVRLSDLVHLTPDGATRTAVWTAAGLAQSWPSG